MTAAVLVDRERGRGGQGVQVVSVDSKIDGISLSRLARETRSSEARPFEFDVELSESAWSQDTFTVRYRFRFGVPAYGQTCKVSGRAVVRFSQFNPVEDVQALGSDVTNEMVVEIFRKNYEAVYLLHQALGMKPPTPWITHGVSLSSRSQAE